MAAILVNIYAGMAAFASLQPIFDYTVAETTILGLIILIAHSLPIEVAIARQSRVSAIFNLLFRFFNAVIAGKILNYIFVKFDLFNEENSSILDIPSSVVSNLDWLILQSKNFLIIFVIIFLIITTINLLKYIGLWQFIINILKIPLSYLGMSEKVDNIILIGLTLGISFGGGFLIEESKKIIYQRKIYFYLYPSLVFVIVLLKILYLFYLGSHISGILFFRMIYTIVIILFMKYLLDTKLENKILDKLTYD